MDNKQMQIIQELMEELQETMQYSEDDLGERLGREKPTAVKMEIEAEPLGMDHMGEDEEMEMGMEEGLESSPEDSLKKRLMKLRG